MAAKMSEAEGLSADVRDIIKLEKSGRGRCVAANCWSSTKRCGAHDFRLHTFPADNSIRQKWIDFVQQKKPDWTPKRVQVLCSDHFTEDSYENIMSFKLGFTTRLFLKRGAFPTIHKEPQFQLLESSPCAQKRKSGDKDAKTPKAKSRKKKDQPSVKIETADSEPESDICIPTSTEDSTPSVKLEIKDEIKDEIKEEPDPFSPEEAHSFSRELSEDNSFSEASSETPASVKVKLEPVETTASDRCQNIPAVSDVSATTMSPIISPEIKPHPVALMVNRSSLSASSVTSCEQQLNLGTEVTSTSSASASCATTAVTVTTSKIHSHTTALPVNASSLSRSPVTSSAQAPHSLMTSMQEPHPATSFTQEPHPVTMISTTTAMISGASSKVSPHPIALTLNTGVRSPVTSCEKQLYHEDARTSFSSVLATCLAVTSEPKPHLESSLVNATSLIRSPVTSVEHRLHPGTAIISSSVSSLSNTITSSVSTSNVSLHPRILIMANTGLYDSSLKSCKQQFASISSTSANATTIIPVSSPGGKFRLVAITDTNSGPATSSAPKVLLRECHSGSPITNTPIVSNASAATPTILPVTSTLDRPILAVSQETSSGQSSSKGKPQIVALTKIFPARIVKQGNNFTGIPVLSSPTRVKNMTKILSVSNTSRTNNSPITVRMNGHGGLSGSVPVSVPISDIDVPSVNPVIAQTSDIKCQHHQFTAAEADPLPTSDKVVEHVSSTVSVTLPTSDLNLRHSGTITSVTSSASDINAQQYHADSQLPPTSDASVGNTSTCVPELDTSEDFPSVSVHCSTKLGQARYLASTSEDKHEKHSIPGPVVEIRKLSDAVRKALCKNSSVKLSQLDTKFRIIGSSGNVVAFFKGVGKKCLTIEEPASDAPQLACSSPVHRPAKNPTLAFVPLIIKHSLAGKTVTSTATRTSSHAVTQSGESACVSTSGVTAPRVSVGDRYKDTFLSSDSSHNQVLGRNQDYSSADTEVPVASEDFVFCGETSGEVLDVKVDDAEEKAVERNECSYNTLSLKGEELNESEVDESDDSDAEASVDVRGRGMGSSRSCRDFENPDQMTQQYQDELGSESTVLQNNSEVEGEICGGVVSKWTVSSKFKTTNSSCGIAKSRGSCEELVEMAGKRNENQHIGENDTDNSVVSQTRGIGEVEDYRERDEITETGSSASRTVRVKYGEDGGECEMDMTVDEVENEELTLMGGSSYESKTLKKHPTAVKISKSSVHSVKRGIVEISTALLSNEKVFVLVVKRLLRILGVEGKCLELKVDFPDGPASRRIFDLDLTGHLLVDAQALEKELKKIRKFLLIRSKNAIVRLVCPPLRQY